MTITDIRDGKRATRKTHRENCSHCSSASSQPCPLHDRERYNDHKRSRYIVCGGVTYYARTETTKRDGGEPPGQWYWTVEDPKDGLVIDERVPGGYWKTLGAARKHLGSFLGIEVAS